MADRVCPKLPIMWGIETLTTLTSMTARKVPDITAYVTSHFFPADAGVSGRLGTGADACERITLRCSVKKLKHFVHKPLRVLAFTLPTAYLLQRCLASYA